VFLLASIFPIARVSGMGILGLLSIRRLLLHQGYLKSRRDFPHPYGRAYKVMSAARSHSRSIGRGNGLCATTTAMRRCYRCPRDSIQITELAEWPSPCANRRDPRRDATRKLRLFICPCLVVQIHWSDSRGKNRVLWSRDY
jgi:hypothetical protein